MLILAGCTHKNVESSSGTSSPTSTSVVVGKDSVPNIQKKDDSVSTSIKTVPSKPTDSLATTDETNKTDTPSKSSDATSKPENQNTETNKQTASKANAPFADNPVITGEFIWSWNNPMDSGDAKVVKKGANKYNLSINVVTNFSHHIGSVEGDFSFDGKKLVFDDPEYKDFKLSFTDNSLTLDYPGDGYGGANAEPKGTYYLINSGITDAPFLQKLYDAIKLPDAYRHGRTDVLTYNTNTTGTVITQELLLVRSKSEISPNDVISETLVLYDVNKKTFTMLGDLDMYNEPKVRKKLEAMKLDANLIYEVLHKDEEDRFITVQMNRFDNGDRSVFDEKKFKLTDQEAFYIVTGEENSTVKKENHRNDKNIGSIFIQEVDHSDDNTVAIHFYELVRNDDTDEHTATNAWLEVNRSTGKVKNTLLDE